MRKDGEYYRHLSLQYALSPGVTPAKIGRPNSSDRFACQSCGTALPRARFPKDSYIRCKRCLRRSRKLRNRAEKIACRVSPLKAQFAAELRRNMTPAERRLWEKLSGLEPAFSCQAVIFGYIADFLCLKRKLVVELDGPYHAAQLDKDKARDEHLARRGYRTIRFTNDEVINERSRVLGAIMEAL